MLSALRGSAGGVIAKGFIVLLAASFAVWGVSDILGGRRDEILASVGDSEIGRADYERAFQRQLPVWSQQIGRALTPDQARQLGLDQQLLSSFIDNAALDWRVGASGLALADETVVRDIAGSPAYQDHKGAFDAERFRRLLRSAGFTEQQFITTQRQDLLRAAIIAPLIHGAELPDALTELIADHGDERRIVRYFTVTALQETAQDLPDGGDGELKAFYEQNPSWFRAPERRVIRFLALSPSRLAQDIAISDAELAEAYERFKADYATPERRRIEQITFESAEQAQAIRNRLDAGMRFAEVAAGRGLTRDDMQLGLFSRAEFPDPRLAGPAFALSLNEISQPLTGTVSTVLLRVTAIEPARQPGLDELRGQLTERLQADRAVDRLLSLQEQIEEALASGQSIADIADALSLEFGVTPALDRQGVDAQAEFFSGPVGFATVLNAAFDSAVGFDNDPLSMPDGGTIWFEVAAVEPARLRPFDDVRAEVESRWWAERQAEALREKLRSLADRGRSGVDLPALAKEENAALHVTEALRRGEPHDALDPGALAAAFAVRAGEYAWGLDPSGQRGFVMQSESAGQESVTSQTRSARKDRRAALSEALAQGLRSDLARVYVHSLKERLGVEVNDALWADMTSPES